MDRLTIDIRGECRTVKQTTPSRQRLHSYFFVCLEVVSNEAAKSCVASAFHLANAIFRLPSGMKATLRTRKNCNWDTRTGHQSLTKNWFKFVKAAAMKSFGSESHLLPLMLQQHLLPLLLLLPTSAASRMRWIDFEATGCPPDVAVVFGVHLAENLSHT